MTARTALRIAKQVAGKDCKVSLHRGDRHNRAIRISGCFPDEARAIGREIEKALEVKDGLRIDPGFAAVWF